MRNGKPVEWVCNLDINCLDCGEVVWCFSDEEIEKMKAELKTCQTNSKKPTEVNKIFQDELKKEEQQ